MMLNDVLQTVSRHVLTVSSPSVSDARSWKSRLTSCGCGKFCQLQYRSLTLNQLVLRHKLAATKARAEEVGSLF